MEKQIKPHRNLFTPTIAQKNKHLTATALLPKAKCYRTYLEPYLNDVVYIECTKWYIKPDFIDGRPGDCILLLDAILVLAKHHEIQRPNDTFRYALSNTIKYHVLKRSYDVLKDKSYFEIIKQSIAPILIFLIKDGEIDEAVNLVTSNYDFVKEKAYDILECIKKNGNKINVSNYDAFLTKFKELKFIS